MNKYIESYPPDEIETLYDFYVNNKFKLNPHKNNNIKLFYEIERLLKMNDDINKRECKCDYKGVQYFVQRILEKEGDKIIEAYKYYNKEEAQIVEEVVLDVEVEDNIEAFLEDEQVVEEPKKRGRKPKNQTNNEETDKA